MKWRKNKWPIWSQLWTEATDWCGFFSEKQNTWLTFALRCTVKRWIVWQRHLAIDWRTATACNRIRFIRFRLLTLAKDKCFTEITQIKSTFLTIHSNGIPPSRAADCCADCVQGFQVIRHLRQTGSNVVDTGPLIRQASPFCRLKRSSSGDWRLKLTKTPTLPNHFPVDGRRHPIESKWETRGQLIPSVWPNSQSQ